MYLVGDPPVQVCAKIGTASAYCAYVNFPYNSWSHVAFVADGDSWQLFVNGKSVRSEGNHLTSLQAGTSDLYFGQSANMDLDLVQIWSAARTATAIAADGTLGIASRNCP
jgi:hypothetical protein